MTNEGSFYIGHPLRVSDSKKAKTMVSCIQEFDHIDCRKVDEHEDEHEDHLVGNEILDSYNLHEESAVSLNY